MAKARFEWDARKDAENRKKHGISFELAQYALPTPARDCRGREA